MKVKFISGDEFTFDLEDNTILEIKKKIAEYKESSIENIKLIYMGKILKDDETFEMHKLNKDSVLTSVIKKNTTSSTGQQNTEQQNTTPSTGQQNTTQSTGQQNTEQQSTEQQNTEQQNIPFNNMFNQNPEMRDMIVNLTIQRMGIDDNHPFYNILVNNLNTMLQNPEMLQQMFSQGMAINQNPELFQNMFNQDQGTIPNFDMNMLNQMMQSVHLPNMQSSSPQSAFPQSDLPQNSSQSNETPVLEVNVDELRNKFPNELEEVKNMGFEDEELILKTLAQSHGSVVITINKLLG